MSHVTLVFEADGERVNVDCNRVTELATEVVEGDYVACPYSGFVHVHSVRVEGAFAVLVDCHDHEHMYPVDRLLEIARPRPEVQA